MEAPAFPPPRHLHHHRSLVGCIFMDGRGAYGMSVASSWNGRGAYGILYLKQYEELLGRLHLHGMVRGAYGIKCPVASS
uniref:Wound-induced protein kinase n=1 Tax=Manihot esculenta TaxID=3983 RepID=Q5XNQ1_MANES|nr:wound-induced protein kinase [Manihot esculenta]